MNRTDSRRLVRILLPYMALWLALAATLASFATYEITKSRAQALESATGEIESVARLAGDHALQTLTAVDRMLATVRVLHERHLTSAGLAEVLPAFHVGTSNGADRADDGVERRILLFDRDGRFVASSNAEDAQRGAVSVADRAYFVEVRDDASEGMRIGEPVSGRLVQRRIVPLVRRLNAPDGSFDGVLVSAVDPERLVATYRGMRLGDSVAVGIVRDDGIVFARNAGKAANVAVLDDAVSQALRAHGSRHPGDATGAKAGDGAMLVALHEIAGTRLLAFASMSQAEALAGHRRLTHNIFAFAVIALGALTLPLWIVGRNAVREVHRRSELERRYEQERRRARSDPLTGLANRIAFNDHIERCNRALTEHGVPFVLAFIDIDRFKALNDSQGHVVGDAALRRIARTLLATVRGTDLVARVGGDEFAVLMPGATAEGSPRICGKLHAALLAAAATADLPIGFSIGVVAFEAPAEPRVVTALADRLMYDVKSCGGEGVRYGVYRRDGLHLAAEARHDEETHAAR
ncbi:MAG TPA: diguanylate cyclase [Casimicrobiaceae bacterium]|nr:diguanylate cyclase [Casimicrobiaceae bacterium]